MSSFHARHDDDDRVNLDEYSERKRPPLTPEMFPRARARTRLGIGVHAALTIAESESVALPGRRAVRVVFSERPDHNWWTNYTMLKILVQKLGESRREWIGARVPLTHAMVFDPSKGEDKPRLYPVQLAEWDEALDAYDVAARARQRDAKEADGAPPAQAAVAEPAVPAKRARKKKADPDAPPF